MNSDTPQDSCVKIPSVQIIVGDCRELLKTLPDESVHSCVTSPPYFGLRDYGHAGQIGMEATIEAYTTEMVAVFRDVWRVLREDGTLWLNLGDSYAGSWGAQGRQGETGRLASRSACAARQIAQAQKRNRTGALDRAPGLKSKDLIGVPWRVAFALQSDGWYLRSDIIWHKRNCMPESVRDRPTRNHEYLFLLSKSARYYYDQAAIEEQGDIPSGTRAAKGSSGRGQVKNVNGRAPEYWEYTGKRNKRTVWTVTTIPYKGTHFATFPPDLIKPCILAGCPTGGTVLDPFGGSGTTGQVALELGRSAILIELNPDYGKLAEKRTNITPGLPL